MKNQKNFINNQFIDSTGQQIPVDNPATGQVISSAPESTLAEADQAIDAAIRAQPAWAKRPAIERASFLRKVAAGIRARKQEIARAITEEQGKMLGLSGVEVAFTADYLDYMAEWARRIEGEIVRAIGRAKRYFCSGTDRSNRRHLPWNFPFFSSPGSWRLRW